MEPGFHRLQFFIHFGDLGTELAHRHDLLRGVFPVFLHLADFSRNGIAQALVSFHFLQQLTAFLVQFLEFIKVREIIVTVLQHLEDLVGILTDKFQI